MAWRGWTFAAASALVAVGCHLALGIDGLELVDDAPGGASHGGSNTGAGGTGGSTGGTGGAPSCVDAECPQGADECVFGECDVNDQCSLVNAALDAACTNADPLLLVCDGAGTCVECNEASQCATAGDLCVGNACVPALCVNGELDPGETSVDCGGPDCPTCANGGFCNEASDCTSNYCDVSGGAGGQGGAGASGVCAACANTGDCGTDEWCDDAVEGGTCVPTLDPGEVCTDGEQCTSTFCTDGVCCGTACGGGTTDCQACNLTGSEGTCSFRPEDAACGDSSTTDCTLPNTCNATGTCLDNHVADETPCGDDVCNECSAGACVASPASQPGPGCTDATNDDCTDPDTCNGAGACLSNNQVDGVACGDDVCDECAAGVCIPTPGTQQGPGCQDSTDNACDNPDFCNGSGTCLANYESFGAPCGDQGVLCLVDDTCDGNGVCTDNGNTADGVYPATGDCGSGCCNGSAACGNNNCNTGEFCDADQDCSGNCDIPNTVCL
jgi:hypothetical protein